MTKRTVIQIVDDLDGSPISDGEGATISFALEGSSYEIDLSNKNADKLRGALAEFIRVARKKSGRGAGRSSTRSAQPAAASASNASAIREWARSQGLDVPARGRIPASITEAYDAAN